MHLKDLISNFKLILPKVRIIELVQYLSFPPLQQVLLCRGKCYLEGFYNIKIQEQRTSYENILELQSSTYVIFMIFN